MRLFKNEEEVKYERRKMARGMQHAYVLGFRDFLIYYINTRPY